MPDDWIANRKEDKSCKWENEIEEESGSEDRRIEEMKKKQVDLDRIVSPKENQFISYEQAPVAKSLSFAVRDSCLCLFELECFERGGSLLRIGLLPSHTDLLTSQIGFATISDWVGSSLTLGGSSLTLANSLPFS